MSIPIILDCDPGLDDVFAIWLAAAHPAIDLRAITTVGGNVPLDYTTRNARIACTVAGIHGVPIAAGAAGPLTGELVTATEIHGEGGLGGPQLPTPTVPLDERDAQTLIRDTVQDSDEPVTIVAIGPLTNIAILARDQPDVFARVARVLWMGGSAERGNVTPYAEFNAYVDPEAAAAVLRTGVDFTMVGLNITTQAAVTRAVRRRIAAIGNTTATFAGELLDFFAAAHEEVDGDPEGPLHDPLTVAMLIDPAVASTVRSHVDIEVVGEFTRGATSVDLVGRLGNQPNATIAMELDTTRFWSLVEEAVRALA